MEKASQTPGSTQLRQSSEGWSKKLVRARDLIRNLNDGHRHSQIEDQILNTLTADF